MGKSSRGEEAYLGDGGSSVTYNFNSDYSGNMNLYIALNDDGIHPDGARNAIITVNGKEFKYEHVSENTLTEDSAWKWYYIGEVPIKESNVISFEKEKTTSAAFIMDKFKLVKGKV